jgi:hypothetical protein
MNKIGDLLVSQEMSERRDYDYATIPSEGIIALGAICMLRMEDADDPLRDTPVVSVGREVDQENLRIVTLQELLAVGLDRSEIGALVLHAQGAANSEATSTLTSLSKRGLLNIESNYAYFEIVDSAMQKIQDTGDAELLSAIETANELLYKRRMAILIGESNGNDDVYYDNGEGTLTYHEEMAILLGTTEKCGAYKARRWCIEVAQGYAAGHQIIDMAEEWGRSYLTALRAIQAMTVKLKRLKQADRPDYFKPFMERRAQSTHGGARGNQYARQKET